MEAGIPTRLTPPTSIHLSNSSIAITQPFPALPGRCWGPTNPSPLSAAQPCCQSQLSPLLTPPSCLWCLWHFPLQHFQAPVAPQPRQLRHSHGRANSNTRRLRSSPRQSLSRGRAAAAGASLASGCPPRPHTQGKPTSSRPKAPAQEVQSAQHRGQLPRTGEPTPQWHSCGKHNPRASSKAAD